MYRLFIDDERFPVDNSWIIARSSQEAIEVVMTKGLPIFISFDHDLGEEDTSMKFLHWLVSYMLDSSMQFPEGFDFYVHSQNPVGKVNIEVLMKNLKFFLTYGKD